MYSADFSISYTVLNPFLSSLNGILRRDVRFDIKLFYSFREKYLCTEIEVRSFAQNSQFALANTLTNSTKP
jgi:hypothetical protein